MHVFSDIVLQLRALHVLVAHCHLKLFDSSFVLLDLRLPEVYILFQLLDLISEGDPGVVGLSLALDLLASERVKGKVLLLHVFPQELDVFETFVSQLFEVISPIDLFSEL